MLFLEGVQVNQLLLKMVLLAVVLLVSSLFFSLSSLLILFRVAGSVTLSALTTELVDPNNRNFYPKSTSALLGQGSTSFFTPYPISCYPTSILLFKINTISMDSPETRTPSQLAHISILNSIFRYGYFLPLDIRKFYKYWRFR